MDKIYEMLIDKARSEGAVYPVIGDASGEPCIVDTDSGRVWYIELRELE
jgi:hypothetical protein